MKSCSARGHHRYAQYMVRRCFGLNTRPFGSTASMSVQTIPTSGFRSRQATCTWSFHGLNASSESRNATYSPRARAMPRLRAVETPPFGLEWYRTRASPPYACRINSAVPSVEPSSTTTTSRFPYVWARALSIVRLTQYARL